MNFFILGVFIARGKEDALVTLNMVPGETVYGEKKIVVEVCVVLNIIDTENHPPSMISYFWEFNMLGTFLFI